MGDWEAGLVATLNCIVTLSCCHLFNLAFTVMLCEFDLMWWRFYGISTQPNLTVAVFLLCLILEYTFYIFYNNLFRVSVSRAIRPFGNPGRPDDWFSQKVCFSVYLLYSLFRIVTHIVYRWKLCQNYIFVYVSWCFPELFIG